jgi:hypothetical protein
VLLDLEKKGLHFSESFFSIDSYQNIIRKANIIVNSFDGFAKCELVIFYNYGVDFVKLTEEKDNELYGAKTPSKFLGSTQTLLFKDRYVQIPSDVYNYIEYHYGKDWKTPKQDISQTYKKPFEKINKENILLQL